MHILFVCNGNVCRSVIAERLTRSIAVEYRLAGVTAESAGTRALVGFPVEPRAAEAITGLGGDPSDFRARKLKPEHIDRADLILTMTENIRDEIAEMTAAGARTFTLLEAHRIARVTGARSVAELHRNRHNLSLVGRENISDPVGLSAKAYCEAGDTIAEALVPLLVALAPVHTPAGRQWGRPPPVVQPARSQARLSPLVAAQHNGWYA
ncbi:low molecular weight phosphatase family protein [Nocardia speluncae]|uniref:protein-tyrosine-phosphatase n=1 Tax=Nocardia speluncae TaxID=419477 RepID=A0A846XMG4_9NOCA|nr:protein tyrosine phosphatase [Nocardia speluncae]NKY36515.1 low molecular weight phosphatase family protein [Nocardia speluncae]